MIVAGIGCRRVVTADAVLEAIALALAQNGIDKSQLGALAVPVEKSADTSIGAAARELALPLIAVSPAALQAASHGVLTISPRVQALKGVASVAEAAALAGAGAGARLIAPRTTMPTVTCALAKGYVP